MARGAGEPVWDVLHRLLSLRAGGAPAVQGLLSVRAGGAPAVQGTARLWMLRAMLWMLRAMTGMLRAMLWSVFCSGCRICGTTGSSTGTSFACCTLRADLASARATTPLRAPTPCFSAISHFRWSTSERPKVGERWEKVGNWTQGEKRGRVSGLLSAALPLLAQEDP
eukprot:1183016-Prorocentrum_minimum.AAC.5